MVIFTIDCQLFTVISQAVIQPSLLTISCSPPFRADFSFSFTAIATKEPVFIIEFLRRDLFLDNEWDKIRSIRAFGTDPQMKRQLKYGRLQMG